MLEAIADFWKPVRRLQAQAKLKAEELQIGSSVQFGFVPQTSLSGRRFIVTAINTYKFGVDILTSFVMTQEKDAGVSMIIADTNGEQYIAVSRRISISDRQKLFLHNDLEAVMSDANAVGLDCKDIALEYKSWISPHYKREIHNVKGHLYRGDHRAGLISGEAALDFSYTLLVSENNEQALEIERYADNRVEVYATVYRRMSDISEVSHPQRKETSRPDVKLVSGNLETSASLAAVSKPEPRLETSHKDDNEARENILPLNENNENNENNKDNDISALAVADSVDKNSNHHEQSNKHNNVQDIVESSPISLREFPQEAVAKKLPEEAEKTEMQAEEIAVKEDSKQEKSEQIISEAQQESVQEDKKLYVFNSDAERLNDSSNNDSNKDTSNNMITASAAIMVKTQTQPFVKQEIKAVNKEISNFVNESIDCELHVANRIIDEAIRNEMRINDVVRRVIGLPVSQQESVQIPVTLTDQDYSLLAIRYGISANDHEAIKRRIIEDLGDFSGGLKKDKKAA